MYMVHLALTSPDWPSPAQADAERLEDRIWARATPELGIQHVHAKAAPHRIDLAVYLAGPGPGEGVDLPCTSVRHILALIPGWTISAADAGSGESAV